VSWDLATRRDAAERLLGVVDNVGDAAPPLTGAALALTLDLTLPPAARYDPSPDCNSLEKNN